MALVDFFLKLDGIDGESQDDKHKGEIDILSWSWGASNTGTGGTGGGLGSGKVSVQDMSFSKFLDKSSAKLWYNCCSGTHIPTGLITCRKAGGDSPLEYLKISLTDIIVSAVQESASGGGGNDKGVQVMESLSLNFAKFKVEYFLQDDTGAGAAAGQMSWNIKANTK